MPCQDLTGYDSKHCNPFQYPNHCCSYCYLTVTTAAVRKQNLQFRYLAYRYSTAQLHQSYANIFPNSKRTGSKEEEMRKVVMPIVSVTASGIACIMLGLYLKSVIQHVSSGLVSREIMTVNMV